MMKEQMKKKFKYMICMLLSLLMVLSSPMAASATVGQSEGELPKIPFEKFLWKDSDGKYTCEYDAAEAGKEYMLFVVPGIYLNLESVESDFVVDNLLYINQKTADGTSVVFNGFVPKRDENSTVIISGTDLEPQILGYISYDYFILGGYSKDSEGKLEIENSYLVAQGALWEDVKETLPKDAFAKVSSEYSEDITIPVSIEWNTAPIGFENNKVGKSYTAIGQPVFTQTNLPANFLNMLGDVKVNLTVQRKNSIPVELTVTKTKTVYQPGEEFQIDDISVKAIYDDNTVRDVADWTTNVDQLVQNESGSYVLTVSYTESGYTATKDIVLYLKEDESQVVREVFFDTRGGSYIPSVYVEDGSVLTLPESPEKNGYVFTGWSYDRYGKKPYDAETVISGDTVLYAQWNNKNVAALSHLDVILDNYNLELGTELTKEMISVIAVYEDGSEKLIEKYNSNLAEIDQTTFGTKMLSVDYTENSIKKKADVTFRVIQSEDVKTCTVTFDTGCDVHIAQKTVLYNELLEYPRTELVKEGYSFAGWYYEQKEWSFEKDKVTSDITLTAKWSKLNASAGEESDIYVYTEEIGTYEYTGKNITPTPVVIDKSLNVLKKGTDYTVKYLNNKEVSTEDNKAEIIITAKGNYSGTLQIPFEIIEKDITAAEDVLITMSQYYKYQEKGYTPIPTVKHGKTSLKKDTHFTVEYYRYDLEDSGELVLVEEVPMSEPGLYYVVVNGKGNYTGSQTTTFEIGQKTQKDVKSATIKLDKAASKLYYTGEAISVNNLVKVSIGKEVFYEGVDYVLIYPENHTDVGTVTVTVKGLSDTGKLYGEKTFTFQIKGLPLKSAKINLSQNKVVYGKEVFTDNLQSVTYTVSSANLEAFQSAGYVRAKVKDVITLEKDKDYTVSYINSENAGKATIELKGKGLFDGTVNKTFDISKVALNSADISCTVSEKVQQSKAGAKPVVKLSYTVNGKTVQLKENVDYTIKLSSNKAVTTKAKAVITGKGNYSGSLTKYFEVTAKKLRSTDITVAVPTVSMDTKKKANYVYKPSVTIYDEGVKLANNKDYQIDYSGCLTQADVLSGDYEGTVIVRAKSASYSGARMITYRVAGTKLSAKNISFVIADQQYTGQPITFDLDKNADANQFQVQMKVDDDTVINLIPNKDFEIVSYKNNIKAGKATVTLQGIGDYSGSKAVTFKITKRPIS